MAETLILRRSLHDEVVGLVRDLVLSGELAPGTKVPERELCQRFGVSRTPMREALKVLAAEGLLQLLPHRGAVVARITPEEIDELFPIMGALEALAGELAAPRITERELTAIRAMHDTMLAHFQRGEWLPYSKLNRLIHEAIFAAAGNGTLSALYQSLMIRIHSVRFVARKTPARWREAVDDHIAIMAALEARDGLTLARILREHLVHKAGMVREALAALSETAAAE